jgi:hypothetical protein
MKKIPMLEKFAAQSLVEYDGECGPFDLGEGEFYVSIYAGN